MIRQVSLSDFLCKLHERWTTSTALTALVPADSIKQHLPQDKPLPYIRYRTQVSEGNTKSIVGFNMNIVIDVWTETRSDKFIMEVFDVLIDLLNDNELNLTTGKNYLMQYLSHDTMVEPDECHHGVINFISLSA